ncbi:MAG: FtsX-like permease family protein [Myxococcota bacterium]
MTLLRWTLWTWAARDLMRRPVVALLMGCAIATFIALFGGMLMARAGLTTTTTTVLADSPHLVVRHVGAGGWAPIPPNALASVQEVRGVVRAKARLWGVVRDGKGSALTIIGHSTPSPAPGTAIVGPIIPADLSTLRLHGPAAARELHIAEHLTDAVGLVAHDRVFLHPDDARALLGLDTTHWSDLAIWVNHDSEMDAIRPDVTAALAFPTQITTRTEALGAARATIEAATARDAVLWAPALLALVLLTLATARAEHNARRDVALLKALGWDTAEIVQLSLLRALLIALPATAMGWGLAWWGVFGTDLSWATAWLFGWALQPAPALQLQPDGALVLLLEVTGLVLTPWLAAVLLPALRSATTDPASWLTPTGGV